MRIDFRENRTVPTVGTKQTEWRTPSFNKRKSKQWLIIATKLFALSFLLIISSLALLESYVYAAPNSGAQIVQNGFNVIYDIIAAIVSSIGSIFLLWGIFEWSQSMSVMDGGAQNIAFKRIGGGLIACLGPQLIPVITQAIGTGNP